MKRDTELKRDYLAEFLRQYFPLHFFALFRAHEAYSVEPFVELLSPPVLDLGCGDGLVSSMLFGRPLEYGIDASEVAIGVAREQGSYGRAFAGDAHEIPLEDGSLGGVFSNCALEHIPDMPALIEEISRVLRPGAYFVGTCLSPLYYEANPWFKALDRPASGWLRRRMIAEENRLHNHVSVFGVEDYRRMFAGAGMELEEHRYYGVKAISGFCCKWDTASKYVVPFPISLRHRGILVRYLNLRYWKLSDKENTVKRWYRDLYPVCYSRNKGNEPGVGQILVARKL